MSRIAAGLTLRRFACSSGFSSSCLPHYLPADQKIRCEQQGSDLIYHQHAVPGFSVRHYLKPLTSIAYDPGVRWSIHNPEGWNWTSSDIRNYLEYWCSTRSPRMQNVTDRQEMFRLYNKIIQPSCENGSPFVALLNDPPTLMYVTVGNGRRSRIPITEFYTAMG